MIIEIWIECSFSLESLGSIEMYMYGFNKYE